MAFSISATSSTVAVTGTLNFSGQNLTTATGQVAASGTTNIKTVTAGKTLYLVSACLQNLTTANNTATVELKDDSGQSFLQVANANGVTLTSSGPLVALTYPPGYFPTVAATKILQCSAGANCTAIYSVQYYEA